MREALHERRWILLLVSFVALRVVVAEDDAPVLRLVLHGRRAVRGCRLLTRWNVVEPDPAHARRRPTLRGNGWRLFVAAALCASDVRGRERRSAQKSQSYHESLHLSSIDTAISVHPYTSTVGATSTTDADLRKRIYCNELHFAAVGSLAKRVRTSGIVCHLARTWTPHGALTILAAPLNDPSLQPACHPLFVDAQELQHLAGLGVTPQLRLLEDRHAVTHDLESATTGWKELHLFSRQRVANLRRQTGGARLVASDRAVLDRDHCLLILSV